METLKDTEEPNVEEPVQSAEEAVEESVVEMPSANDDVEEEDEGIREQDMIESEETEPQPAEDDVTALDGLRADEQEAGVKSEDTEQMTENNMIGQYPSFGKCFH